MYLTLYLRDSFNGLYFQFSQLECSSPITIVIKENNVESSVGGAGNASGGGGGGLVNMAATATIAKELLKSGNSPTAEAIKAQPQQEATQGVRAWLHWFQ